MSPVEVSPGVLAVSQIKELFDGKKILPRGSGLPGFDKMDGSAFDLPIGKRAWKLEQAERPATRELHQIQDRSTPHKPEEDGDHFLFEKGKIYLVELDYDLKLPSKSMAARQARAASAGSTSSPGS